MRSSKWLSCPLKNYLIFDREGVTHTLDNWFRVLSHRPLSIYPDDVCCTYHNSGVFIWVSWYYSFAWCTMMGGVKHFPSDQVKTRNVRHNGAFSPGCISHISSPKNNINTDYFVTHSIGINPNFVTVPHLSLSWLDLIEVIGDVNIFIKG